MSSSERLKSKSAGLDLAGDRVEPLIDLLRLGCGDDAGRGQHGGMCLGGKKIWSRSRLSKSMEAFISSMIAAGFAANLAAPHGIGHERQACKGQED